MPTKFFYATLKDVKNRLDKFISLQIPNLSRSYIQYLISSGNVLINNKKAKKNLLLKNLDKIQITLIEKANNILLKPQKINLNILYEDEHVIIINKHAGMVTHPGCNNFENTFVNALLYHCNLNIKTTQENEFRPGIVHRLDKDTSGCLIAAKNDLAQQSLSNLFFTKRIQKTYLAICLNVPADMTISAPIGRDHINRLKMTISKKGKHAITKVKLMASYNNFSLIRVNILTGRTHQIRVHLKYMNFPILGDQIYGNININKQYKINRQLLHAHQLKFIHPINKNFISVTAKPPEDFDNLLKKLML